MEATLPRPGRWLWLGTFRSLLAEYQHHARCAPLRRPRKHRATQLKTESPYFLVKSDDPEVDRLPLKGTEVDVKISGVIADVTVRQTYRNEGHRPIEARYVFPGSTKAAISWTQRSTCRSPHHSADPRKGAGAHRVRQRQARRQGAALLEQQLPNNVFQMNVANILPGDDVKVELRYTELLVPQRRCNYQFVFPTVASPRYNSPQSEHAQARWRCAPT